MISRMKKAYRKTGDLVLSRAVTLQNGLYRRATRTSRRAQERGIVSIEMVVILSAIVVVTLTLWQSLGDTIVASLQELIDALT